MQRSLRHIGLLAALVLALAGAFGQAHAAGGTDDIIVRTQDGRLLLYPFSSGSFQGSGIQVGHGFSGMTHYLLGDWTQAWADDLVVG